jgi:2-polyprenyl-3-methyl-5-hydroxy-6-metoxy-1,4-benzoquinol methylase
MTKDSYFIATGETDKLRLSILNKIYNPVALQFLKKVGLNTGMKVLEFGCGTGVMACELAKAVGPTGRVIAIDNSEAQLDIAKFHAKALGLSNVEFVCCDVENIDTINEEFDFCYGRWILEFTKNTSEILKKIYASLKAKGIFTCEICDVSEAGHFSSPHSPVVDQWHALMVRNFQSLGLDVNLGNKLFHMLKALNFQKMTIEAHQPIALTPEEKSVYRLALLSVKASTIQRKVISEKEIDDMIQGCLALEQSDTITGFIRNLLIAAQKKGE